MSKKPVVLVICDYYLPGFESGGAVRTIANMVDRLGNRFDFRVVTRDHDGTAVREAYTTVTVGAWNQVGNAQVFYLPKNYFRAGMLKNLINVTNADIVYLNSFFSRLTIQVLALLRLRRIEQKRIILAPEGEFSAGALSLRSLKKRSYISFARRAFLLRTFIWKAASESERADIVRVLGGDLIIEVAPNMPPRMIQPDYSPSSRLEKKAGRARMVFLSRFARKKNFNWLLKHLGVVKGTLSFDIWGTHEDPEYWAECRTIAATLPPNVTIQSKGPISHEMVAETLGKYDFFILPTLGENFGHVFIEAFASGLPVITSDQTPWRNLQQKGIGWDISLEDTAEWNRVIEHCLAMDDTEHKQMSAASRDFANAWLSNSEIEKSNIEILEGAVHRNSA